MSPVISLWDVPFLGDCPDFRVNENGTVPFDRHLGHFNCADTKNLTAPFWDGGLNRRPNGN
jgi:hypothetical protein